ncbi:MAG: molybdate ABC transporter substrate-binding protein [Cyanobacteria bacterium P01_H01_bin.15]
MKKQKQFAIATLGLGLTAGYAALQPTSMSTTTLTISAAASLQDVLSRLASQYEAVHPELRLALNFGSSGALQQQIEQGASVDLFISAAPEHMEALIAKGRIVETSRRDLLQNELVLVTPRSAPNLSTFTGLTQPEITRIGLGEPTSVPAGQYAQETLSFYDITAVVNPKAIYGKNVRQVLNYVAAGNVDAGIVYRSDALTTDAVKIAVIAPAGAHSPVIYPGAVVADSLAVEAGEAFLAYLQTPAAITIFQAAGFETLIPPKKGS